jgi:hypothetical protein
MDACRRLRLRAVFGRDRVHTSLSVVAVRSGAARLLAFTDRGRRWQNARGATAAAPPIRKLRHGGEGTALAAAVASEKPIARLIVALLIQGLREDPQTHALKFCERQQRAEFSVRSAQKHRAAPVQILGPPWYRPRCSRPSEEWLSDLDSNEDPRVNSLEFAKAFGCNAGSNGAGEPARTGKCGRCQI